MLHWSIVGSNRKGLTDAAMMVMKVARMGRGACLIWMKRGVLVENSAPAHASMANMAACKIAH